MSDKEYSTKLYFCTGHHWWSTSKECPCGSESIPMKQPKKKMDNIHIKTYKPRDEVPSFDADTQRLWKRLNEYWGMDSPYGTYMMAPEVAAKDFRILVDLYNDAKQWREQKFERVVQEMYEKCDTYGKPLKK